MPSSSKDLAAWRLPLARSLRCSWSCSSPAAYVGRKSSKVARPRRFSRHDWCFFCRAIILGGAMAIKILVVDDDAHIREVVRFALEKAGFDIVEAGDGQKALGLFQRTKADLIVLDITMPEMDGLAVCREIRKTSDVPILFLSSRTDEVDRVVGLEVGGDDYVVKPFSPRELVARAQAILKRTRGKSSDGAEVKALNYGDVRLDVLGHGSYWKEKKILLTAPEFSLF